MRKIEKLLLTGCSYSILILILFYAFAAISKLTAPAIAVPQFALILSFGFIIALAELMYNVLKLKKALKCLIHYAVLLVAFCLIFIISGNIASGKAAAIFVAIIVFTFLYFAIYFTVRLIRMTVSKADDYIDSKVPKKETKKQAYKPLYKDGE